MSEHNKRVPLVPRFKPTPPIEQTIRGDFDDWTPVGLTNEYPHSDVPDSEYNRGWEDSIVVGSDEVVIPNLGKFKMAQMTRKGREEELVKSPGLTTVRADEYEPGWTGDFGFMRGFDGGLVVLVADPISSLGEITSKLVAGYVSRVCEVVRKQGQAGDAFYYAFETLKKISGEIWDAQNGGYFTCGLLCLNRSRVDQIMIGDAGFLYKEREGFSPRVQDMLQLGSRNRDGRFAPNVVGIPGHIERALKKTLRVDDFKGSKFIFATDVMQKLAGYGEWDSPGGKSEKLDKVMAESDPARRFAEMCKGVDDAVVVYGELD